MRIVSTSYSKTEEFDNPNDWLKRISFYTGILDELARHHEVISIERINYNGQMHQNGVQYSFWKFRNKVAHFPFHLHRHIKGMKPDVVFVNGLIFPMQIIQLKLKLGTRARIMVLHRAEKPFRGFRKWLQMLADKCVNGYFFTSSEFGDDWIKKGSIKDRGKIHEAIQASSSFRPELKSAARASLTVSGGPLFLWVGRLDANKDPITVVRAFIDFLSLWPSAKLYMIFQSNDLIGEIRQLIATDDKATGNIILVGRILHRDLGLWYSAADFIISGSHYEGSGIAICEAMSCGCIPLVTDIPSFRKMTGPGKCGLLYQPGDKDDLLKKLILAVELNMDLERSKVLIQFRDELSFEAIAGKMNRVMKLVPGKKFK